MDSADLSGVSGTPSFFINGRRHYGRYDIAALTAAVQAAKAASLLPPASRSAARILSRELGHGFDRLALVRREAWSAINCRSSG